MLRAALIIGGAALFLGALCALAAGLLVPGIIGVLVWSAVLVAGLAFERYRYKRLLASRPGDGWQATEEKFVDPATGRNVSVYFQPSSGRRAYVDETTAD